MPEGNIFGLIPFTPKRTLILPCEGGEITLYVLDGKAYPALIEEIGQPPRYEIRAIHFSGWKPAFKSDSLNIPEDRLVGDEDFRYIELEIAFRLITLGNSQTAEIVAVSYDGCRTFFENELSTLPAEYSEPAALAS